MTKSNAWQFTNKMSESSRQIDLSADLVFEVRPDGAAFDGVRKAIVDQIAREYDDVLSIEDVRGSIRVDVVELNSGEWRVEGAVGDTDQSIRFKADVAADEKAAGQVLDYLKTRIDDRFDGAIDTDRIRFAEIDLRPAAWFVDARIPPQE